MNATSYITVDAGMVLWPRIRSIAAFHGLTTEESKGIFSRSFVIRGNVGSLQEAAADLQDLFDAIQAQNRVVEAASSKSLWQSFTNRFFKKGAI